MMKNKLKGLKSINTNPLMKGSGSQKYLGYVNTNKFELGVYECACCGFHLGVDSRFLLQSKSKIWIRCPNCECKFDIKPVEKGEINE